MPTTYITRHGDTLPLIASHYGVSLEWLAQINNIYWPYNIFIGQKLIIPTSEMSRQTNEPSDWVLVESTIGKKGSIQDGVLKFTFPRYDLNVHVGAVSIEPELALTSWIAFVRANGYSMVMGDLVLLESEITPVTSQLIANGLEITALHNHLLGELPRIMYMHISGMGNAAKLAQGIKNVLSVTNTPLSSRTVSQTLPAEYWSSVEAIMGKKGNGTGRVIQFSFPRADKISMDGVTIPPSVGVSQAINFQAEGQNAAITGDFVLTANGVNPVAKTLNEYGIAVTALHSHMLTETPRLFFMHFWAVDNREKLAYGLRRALVHTKTIT